MSFHLRHYCAQTHPPSSTLDAGFFMAKEMTMAKGKPTAPAASSKTPAKAAKPSGGGEGGKKSGKGC